MPSGVISELGGSLGSRALMTSVYPAHPRPPPALPNERACSLGEAERTNVVRARPVAIDADVGLAGVRRAAVAVPLDPVPLGAALLHRGHELQVAAVEAVLDDQRSIGPRGHIASV